jgi:hypothetical protein
MMATLNSKTFKAIIMGTLRCNNDVFRCTKGGGQLVNIHGRGWQLT